MFSSWWMEGEKGPKYLRDSLAVLSGLGFFKTKYIEVFASLIGKPNACGGGWKMVENLQKQFLINARSVQQCRRGKRLNVIQRRDIAEARQNITPRIVVEIVRI